MIALYVEAVQTLAKATGNRVSSKSIKSIHKLLDQHEPAVLKAINTALKGARKRFGLRFKVDNVVQRFERLGKSVEDDVTKYIQGIMAQTFGDEITQDVTDALEPVIQDIIKQVSSDYNVTLRFDVVNQKAVEYLQDHADNYFTTLSDEQAQGIYTKIATEMASAEKYTLRDIVSSIRDNFLIDTMYFQTSNGVRAVDTNDWAYTVARTETARAASFSQRATLEDLGMKTWQWCVQDSGCDICDQNDDEIVAIGDDFPSGDSEAPAHPNCRCVVVACMSELTTLQEDDTSDEGQQ